MEKTTNTTDSKDKISLNDFELLNTVGTGILKHKFILIKLGSFGRVRLGKHKKSGKIYAIKMLKKSEIIRSKQVDHIHSEFNILKQLNHPFIVKF